MTYCGDGSGDMTDADGNDLLLQRRPAFLLFAMWITLTDEC